MNENMLLYWMYVVRLNSPQRCAWGGGGGGEEKSNIKLHASAHVKKKLILW